MCWLELGGRHALRDGYILGGEAEYYAGLARRIENRHQTRWANQSLESLNNGRTTRTSTKVAEPTRR